MAAEKTAIEKDIEDYLNSQIKPGDDLTNLIANASMEALTGWESTVTATPSLNENVAEVYQNSFDIHQTLHKLPKGRYTLTAQAFQRCGWGAAGYDGGSGTNVNVYLYANENATKIHHIADCAQTEPLYTDGSDTPAYPYDSYDAQLGYFPNSMAGANVYFSADTLNYRVELSFFLQGEDKQDVTLGLRGGSTDGGWWTLFDNFTLRYHGNNAADYAFALDDLKAQIDATIADQTVTTELTDRIAADYARVDQAYAR